MIFKTESGSTYEVDEVAKYFRRLSGPRPPRRGVDGKWEAYVALWCVVGRSRDCPISK
jgi:hypothetical protein